MALSPAEASSQSVGKEGNRVVGVVFHDDGAPAADAHVGVFHNEDAISDSANHDGVFYLTIPKQVSVFQLVFRAPGYWAAFTGEITSNGDPIKMQRVTLAKKNPQNKAQLETIDLLLQTELAVYRETKSKTVQKAMKDELIAFSRSIDIPAVDPTMGMTMQEREMRIRARVAVDTAVAKMK